MRKFGLYITIGIIAIISACSSAMYEHEIMVDNSVWDKDSVLVFQFDVSDTLSVYNLYFNVKNTGYYPFSNLWLFVETQSPRGNVQNDTLEYMLADDKGWYGSYRGNEFTYKAFFKQNVRFPAKGKYTVKAKHGMRRKTLNEFLSLGLEVKKIQK